MEKKEGSGGALIVGAGFGALAALLATRPAAGAPDEKKSDYVIKLLEELVATNAATFKAIQDLTSIFQAVVNVLTPWIAKDPEQIFDAAITTAGTFECDKMTDFKSGKRMIVWIESSLDQAVQVQVTGNINDNKAAATNIGAPIPVPINTNQAAVLGFGNWHPYVGVRITAGVAPTAGRLTVWTVIQE